MNKDNKPETLAEALERVNRMEEVNEEWSTFFADVRMVLENLGVERPSDIINPWRRSRDER